jgi:uncharacterized protein YjlB
MAPPGKATLTALRSLDVSRHQIPAFNNFPNTSIQGKPLFIYHSAFQDPTPTQIESHLNSVGIVVPSWRYTMYSTSHFHSNTHEVLAVSAGSAKLCFGGECNPDRVEPVVEKGDVIVVPAGVAHRLLEERGDFSMVGSYPGGKSWDMCYGRSNEAQKVKNIQDLEWFAKDPIYGDKGPAIDG